jgi:citrate synthase
MSKKSESKQSSDISDWWRTSIIDMSPGRIEFRGQPVQDLIGHFSFTQMIWFMTVGEELCKDKEKLLEAALVAAVDHGPQAPSIAIARMAVTCGIDINNAMASALNVLGDVHGGAGEQAVELYSEIANLVAKNQSVEHAVIQVVERWRNEHGKFTPGFGHRFHKSGDPRSPRLLELVREAASRNAVSGLYADIGETIERYIASEKHTPVPMNIDGATAVIFCELGCPAKLARGLFCLSRSVGILAHAYEQTQQGGRNKGPTPPDYLWTYDS